jgi:hypothetical protein
MPIKLFIINWNNNDAIFDKHVSKKRQNYSENATLFIKLVVFYDSIKKLAESHADMTRKLVN